MASYSLSTADRVEAWTEPGVPTLGSDPPPGPKKAAWADEANAVDPGMQGEDGTYIPCTPMPEKTAAIASEMMAPNTDKIAPMGASAAGTNDEVRESSKRSSTSSGSLKRRPSLGSNPAMYEFASPDTDENGKRDAEQEGDERQASVKSSIASLCNCCIGVGVLTMPLAFKKVGILPGMCLMFLCAGLCFFTMVLLQEVMLETKATTYSGCIRAALGDQLAKFTDVAIIVFMFGRLTAYCSVVTALFLDLLVEGGLIEGEVFGGGFLTNRFVFSILIGGFVLYPLNIPDKIDALKHLSIAATTCMTFAICCITFRGLQRMAGVEGQPSFPCEECADPVVWPGFKIEFFNAFATYCFAYSTHGNMVVILSELKNPTRKRGIMCFAGLIAYASSIYPVMANLGYGQFTDRTCSNIIQSYSDDALLVVARVGVLVCVTGGHPVNGFPLKVSTECLLIPKEKRSPAVRKMIITFWCVLSTLLAASGATIDSFVEIAGGFGGSATAFVLPAMAYQAIKTKGWTMRDRLLSKYTILSASCGALVGLLTILVVIKTAGSPTVETSCENLPCCGDNANRECCATA